MVYDITNRDSFKNMSDWIVEVERYKRDNASVFIVGKYRTTHTTHGKQREKREEIRE